MTRTATASCWAKARAAWCSRNMSTPKRAAPRSTPNSSAMACPATPITSRRPSPDGDGAYRCMKAALRRAGLSVSDIDYVNAHGTSTPLGDEIELRAVRAAASAISTPTLSMSSTKSAIGHLLGAAGAVEAIYYDPRAYAQCRAADTQSRQSFRRDGDRPRAPKKARREVSTWLCPTPSVLAGPTPRWFSPALKHKLSQFILRGWARARTFRRRRRSLLTDSAFLNSPQ